MKITAEILARVESRNFGFNDPCVICGVPFGRCPHSVEDTQQVIKTIRRMKKAERDSIRRGN